MTNATNSSKNSSEPLLQSDSRITELEIKFARQEDLLEQLSEVLYEQQKTIDQLSKSLTALLKANTLVHGQELGPANEIPPHY